MNGRVITIFSPKGQAESAKKCMFLVLALKHSQLKKETTECYSRSWSCKTISHTYTHTSTHTHTDLIAGPASEAVRVELVDVENMNGTFDAEVMELAGHFEK